MAYLRFHTDGDISARLEPTIRYKSRNFHISALGLTILKTVAELAPITSGEVLDRLGAAGLTARRAKYRAIQKLRRQFLISKRKRLLYPNDNTTELLELIKKKGEWRSPHHFRTFIPSSPSAPASPGSTKDSELRRIE